MLLRKPGEEHVSLWARLFGKKASAASTLGSDVAAANPRRTPGQSPVGVSNQTVPAANVVPPDPLGERPTRPPLTGSGTPAAAANRRIRVFISSTFRDMIEERDELMTHTWPALRQLCQERH